ncbi:hypothetical protein [Kluyvera ascorbata]|uniref:hypothetical protein n=1 Tax=Kluyvera ascorbata TaxID=51288 RepID=UPI002903765F|nr:hypothetical protein [Kluyvera ascorbata]MDU1197739.1 hypothetical protein [Kluyvera ascorbata]
MKPTYEQLEQQLAAVVAENAGMKQCAVNYEHAVAHWNSWADAEDKIPLAPETPATDAYLAEVRAQGVEMARNAMIDFVEGEVGPNENVPGLIRAAEICVSIAAQLRQGAKS